MIVKNLRSLYGVCHFLQVAVLLIIVLLVVVELAELAGPSFTRALVARSAKNVRKARPGLMVSKMMLDAMQLESSHQKDFHAEM